MLEQLFAFRNRPRLVDLRVPADTLGIDHERRALVHAALIVEDVVGFADRAVGPVVGKQWERNPAELLSPRFQAGNGVGADLEDLDVLLLEFFEVRTEPADLILSSAGEGEWQKCHDGRFAAETRE